MKAHDAEIGDILLFYQLYIDPVIVLDKGDFCIEVQNSRGVISILNNSHDVRKISESVFIKAEDDVLKIKGAYDLVIDAIFPRGIFKSDLI